MRRAQRTALAAATALVVLAAPAAQAAPSAVAVPGRFCKTSDAGKVVTTAKWGKVKCVKVDGRYRWKDIRG